MFGPEKGLHPPCLLLPTLRLLFYTEDGSGRFLRNTVHIYQTARRYIPEDRNVHAAVETSNLTTV
jgi:hypothetical protein